MKLGRRFVALASALVLSVGLVTAVSAALPATTVDPSIFGSNLATLAGETSVNVLSVDAFTRAINQAHGTHSVLQYLHFTDGRSTGWHEHPGPNIVLVVKGELQLTDEHCNVTTYGPGQGFATGLDVHKAVAVGETDFYSLYFLPQDADVLRDDAPAPVCAN